MPSSKKRGDNEELTFGFKTKPSFVKVKFTHGETF